MKLVTFQHSSKKGWSIDSFPNMDSLTTVVYAFGDSDYYRKNPQVVQDLAKAYPKSHIVGCSGSGSIHGTEVSDGILSVAVAQFEKTKIKRVVVATDDFKSSGEMGRHLGSLLDSKGLKHVFILSDGLNVDGSELARGLGETVSDTVVVTGGLAGDGDRFAETWILTQGEIAARKVVALGFEGENLIVKHGSRGGWDKFGMERTVTKSENNVLFELDGRPALDLYKEYLGALASELPASALLFPLEITEKDKPSYVRTILAIDEDKKTMTFAGNVPQGARAQLMKANFERIINGAAEAAVQLGSTDSKNPVLLLSISCVGRRLILKERTEEEVEATLAGAGPTVQNVGFYSYGEISPLVTGGSCDLHNQTMTLTTVEET